MKKDRFSLSRFLYGILTRGTPTGYELDVSNELLRSVLPKWKTTRGEPGHLVPSNAFMARDVQSSTSLVGKKVRQLPGIIGWSACVAQGAQILGPFRDSDVTVYHDSTLPTATWVPEIGTVTEADPGFVASVMSPKRICAQVAISRQLLVQSTGNQALDEFIASRLRLVFSSRLDQACLYGTGAANNQPQGVISTAGTNSVTVSSPIAWGDVANMRYMSTNADASPESFGFIVGPGGRQTFETTTRFPGNALTIWDAIRNECEVSKTSK
jgi:hypothetical protein